MSTIFSKLSDKSWHYIHRRFRTPFYTHIFWDATTKHYDTDVKFPYEFDNFLYLNEEIAIGEDDWELMRKKINTELLRDKYFLIKLLKRSYKINRGIERWARKLNNRGFEDSTLKDLLRLWISYQKQLGVFSVTNILPLFVEGDMEKMLKNAILTKFPDDDQERIFQSLTTPIKQGASQGQEIDLLKLAEMHFLGKLADAEIDRYLEKYAWISNNAFDGKFLSKEDVIARVKIASNDNPTLKLKDFLEKIKAARKQFLYYRSKFSSDARSLIDTIQESIFHRSWRTERYYRNAMFLQSFFARTAEVLNLTDPKDLFYLVYPEIIEGLMIISDGDAISLTPPLSQGEREKEERLVYAKFPLLEEREKEEGSASFKPFLRDEGESNVGTVFLDFPLQGEGARVRGDKQEKDEWFDKVSRLIKERKKGYAVLATKQDTHTFSGRELEELKKVVHFNISSGDQAVKGQTAYPGIAKGRVCLVISKSEIDKIQDGDILVTPSTTVDFVPVLGKVKAIITDEGGILSHASVISRELHIPCIIGTKNATKVLKDGNMVEVDADNGIVKILTV